MSDKNIDFKNKFNLQISDVGKHKCLVEKLIYDEHRSNVKNVCREIARGVLLGLHINPALRDLCSILTTENNYARTNLDAVALWIFEKSPNQKEFNRDEVVRYASHLKNYLNDYLSEIDQ